MDQPNYESKDGLMINTKSVDRDALINMLISRVRPIYGNTTEEKIADATMKVANAIQSVQVSPYWAAQLQTRVL